MYSCLFYQNRQTGLQCFFTNQINPNIVSIPIQMGFIVQTRQTGQQNRLTLFKTKAHTSLQNSVQTYTGETN